jgi:hypothetical protein
MGWPVVNTVMNLWLSERQGASRLAERLLISDRLCPIFTGTPATYAVVKSREGRAQFEFEFEFECVYGQLYMYRVRQFVYMVSCICTG